MSGEIPSITLASCDAQCPRASDHRRIVGAPAKFRDSQRNPAFGADGRCFSAQKHIRCDTAADQARRRDIFFQRQREIANDLTDDNLSKRCSQIRRSTCVSRIPCRKRKRGLDSTEGKIASFQSCHWQCNRRGISRFSERVESRTAWISQPQNRCCLVECFACGIVDCRPDQLSIQRRTHSKEACMTARSDQSNCGPFERRAIEQSGDKVRHHMIDSDEWHSERPRNCLGGTCSHKQRSDQSRSMTCGDSSNVRQCDASVCACASNDGDDSVQVRAAGNLGNDAAIFLMQTLLPCSAA